MVIVILYWMLFTKKVRLDFRMIVVAVILVALLIPFVYDNVVTKFEGTHGSAALRAYDLYMGIDIIKQFPLCGIGLDPDRYLKQTTIVDLGYYDITRLDTNRGNTNTFISVAAFLGIPVVLLFIWSLYKQSIFRDRKIVFLILLLSLMSEPLFGQLFLFVICFSSITIKRSVSSPEGFSVCNNEVENEE